ncbi:MAG: ABC transporter substrate-binding protein [Gemmatimonadota bacterium]
MRAGPFRASGSGTGWGIGCLLVLLAACAPSGVEVGGGPVPPGMRGPEGEAVRPESGRDAPLAAALEAASAARATGDWEAAGTVADSAARSWWGRPGLPDGEAAALASLLVDLGEEVRAAELLLLRPEGAGGEAGLDALRLAVRGMSVAELEALGGGPAAGITDRYAAGVVAVEHARALVLAGRRDEGLGFARRLVDRDLDGTDRRELRRVLDGEVSSSAEPLRIGAVLSLTGWYSRAGEQLRDGIELAFRERAAVGSGPDVELVIVDDSSDVDRGAELARRLAEEGVVAVLGPIRSEALLAAAAGRPYAGLTILSPTANSDSGTGPNAGSLWERSRREAGIGTVLGHWLPQRLGLVRLAALHPDDDGGRAGVEAFERAAHASGAEVVIVRAYDPDSTTFARPITAIAQADADAVLVLTDASRTVLQIAPQLAYYGLRSRVIAGDDNWAEPSVLRQLDPAFSDYRVVAIYLDRSRQGSAWERFREAYERTYERGLPDNLLPALGFDAASVALSSVPDDGLPRPGALSRRLRALRRLEAVTGTLRVAPVEETASGGDGGWTLVREVIVRMVVDGALVEADPTAISDWREEARRQEGRLEERETGGREEIRRRSDGAF